MLALLDGQEWIIIAVVALLLFGGSQLPKLARSIGQAQKEFKKGLNEGMDDDEKSSSDKS
ncbi:MAG: twin-arginine translocase TatA/TatE family subunit [Acidimicrobiales bacterium]|nr:twin-arginine translocase TatA/TatE family subunit [Acidimicrobiales bacterium]